MLGFSAVSEAPLSTLLDAQVSVAQTRIFRFSTQSFVTRATDAPAHEYIPGRITSGLTLGRRLNSAADGQFGALLEASFGEIELANADGGLDNLVNQYYADGQKLVLKIGATEINSLGREDVKPYNDFATVYTAIAGEWSFETDVVRLRISGYHTSARRSGDRNAARLQDRLQRQTYAGTGGQTGTSDMTGRTLPTAFGRCLNVPAQLIDPAILTYQLHGGSLNAITAVYDAGISVPFDADYATYPALEVATVPAGSYAASITTGCIRLGVAPTGTVTADVRGDDNGGYTDEHAGVIKKILLNYSNLVLSDLDVASFTALASEQPNSMGLFLPAGDQSSIEDVIERVAFSCGAFAGQDRSGLYRVALLQAPAAHQHWSFTDRDIISLDRVALPYSIPWKSWGVSYQINWTVQKASDLAAGVDQARRQFLESESRYAYAQSPAIANAHLTSSGAPLRPSLFLAEATALAEAERLIAFYSLGRAMYRLVVKTVLFSVEIGQTVRITYPRSGLQNGKHFIVLGIADDADASTTDLLVFG